MPRPNRTRPLTVFLCHASDDKPLVRALYERLRDDGYAPWLDEENLVPGQVWKEEIPKAVRASDVVLVCLSRNTAKEGYLQKEIKIALEAADEKPEGVIFIVPLRLEDCRVPDRLSEWQWVNYFEPRGHERLTRALEWRAQTLATDYQPLGEVDVRIAQVDSGVELTRAEAEFRRCVTEYRAYQRLGESQSRVVVDQRLASGVGRLPAEKLGNILDASPNDQETGMAVAVSLGVVVPLEDEELAARLLVTLLQAKFERTRFRAAYSIRLRLGRGVPLPVRDMLREALNKALVREKAHVVSEIIRSAYDASGY